MFKDFSEASAALRGDLPQLERRGITYHPDVRPRAYAFDAYQTDFALACDAQPGLVSASNAGIPAFLTTLVDPQVYKILVAPNEMAKIIGETRKGDWLSTTAMFPTVERTGEVTSYGDFATGGRAGLNVFFPQRQAYVFQVIKEWGERELELAGLARISWASEVDEAAAVILMKFENYTYAFGVAGLQNYGLLNDPNLTAALTPAPKANGGVKWINGTTMNATANEVYADIEQLFVQLVLQSSGLVKRADKLVLAMSPVSEAALTITNSFNVNVGDLIKKNFPNLEVMTAIQYGATSASNPQGNAGGNLVQLIAPKIEGQDVGYCSFSEKQRSHPVIRDLSSFRQKVSSGSWGAIIRQPFAIAQLLGV